MPRPRRHTVAELDPAFAALRARLGVEIDPPAAAVLEAQARARQGPDVDGHRDLGDLAFWSIDPDGSRDLDQAMFLERSGSGFVLHYAIADVGAWVRPGDAIDDAARASGTTVYCPDRRAPLHPTELSEAAASLLDDGRARPAVVWRIALNQRGAVADVALERAMVRNTAARTYREVQAECDAGRAGEQARLLGELGALRRELEATRGGISLQLPEQSVERVGDHYELSYESVLAIEHDNAQLSLCTGMAAADLMVDAGVGILRTLPAADDAVIEGLRRQARALGFDWPPEVTYPDFIRGIDGSTAHGAALMTQAARTLRGAGYLAFDGNLPGEHHHAAVAAAYAHVTAPLRRLVDRAATECALAASAGRRPDAWVIEALAELPSLMSAAGQRSSAVDRAVFDVCEAAVLAHRVGELFEGRVLASSTRGATVQLLDPAVITSVDMAAELGATIRLRLRRAEPTDGVIEFAPI